MLVKQQQICKLRWISYAGVVSVGGQGEGERLGAVARHPQLLGHLAGRHQALLRRVEADQALAPRRLVTAVCKPRKYYLENEGQIFILITYFLTDTLFLPYPNKSSDRFRSRYS